MAGPFQTRPVDELIVELAAIVAEFERHDLTTTYPRVDKPKQHIGPHSMPDSKKLEVLPYSDGANRAIKDLISCLKGIEAHRRPR